MAELFLLRHGEVEGEPCLLGRTDRACTQVGRAAMHTAVKNIAVNRVISSPLIRCAQFSQEFAQQKKIPCRIDERLQEINFGDWDGLALQTFWSQYEQESNQYFSDPFSISPPNGEQTKAFVQRVAECLTDCINEVVLDEANAQQQQGNTLIVAHGGVIKTMLAQALNMQAGGYNWFSQIKIDYASLSSISYWKMDAQHHDNTQQNKHLPIYSMLNFINR